MKQDICELNMDELRETVKGLGEPAFRAGQLYGWLHRQKVRSFEEMSNLPAAFRQRLSEEYVITVMDIEDVLVSAIDGTRKYLFALHDGNVIEAVLMKYSHDNSVCVSSQVGCRMGCRFCASTLDGCVRNLSAAEMLAEVYRIGSDIGERISNVVIMGSGEPLDNYAEVLRFIRMLSDENGLHISARNITLSTCGIAPEIRRLAEEKLPVTLALSLHAPGQAQREALMPIARKYALDEVLRACRDYYQRSGRRLSFEYAVVRGVNDGREEAEALAKLLREYFPDRQKGRGGREGAFHVNLIPVNPIEERSFRSPDRESVRRFQSVLEGKGINATIRREMGRDISSACGQLRRRRISDRGTIMTKTSWAGSEGLPHTQCPNDPNLCLGIKCESLVRKLPRGSIELPAARRMAGGRGTPAWELSAPDGINQRFPGK